jgi:TPR repeat protein
MDDVCRPQALRAGRGMLGDLYWDGTVVARDRAQAIKWYMLASQTAGRDANPHIADRLESMLEEASDSERLSGRMSAELWADRFPETTSMTDCARPD